MTVVSRKVKQSGREPRIIRRCSFQRQHAHVLSGVCCDYCGSPLISARQRSTVLFGALVRRAKALVRRLAECNVSARSTTNFESSQRFIEQIKRLEIEYKVHGIITGIESIVHKSTSAGFTRKPDEVAVQRSS